MKALQVHAGPRALQGLREHGLRACDVRAIPGAAGGPKGLVLSHLDQYIFGEWLQSAQHPVHLVGASIGAWRMATACLPDPKRSFMRLADDYIPADVVEQIRGAVTAGSAPVEFFTYAGANHDPASDIDDRDDFHGRLAAPL